MKTFAQKLTDEVERVAPVHGVSIGKKDDPSTWRIDFKDDARAEQRDAAKALLSQLNPEVILKKIETDEAIAALEASITPRRLREAVLGLDNGWLEDLNKQIEELRK